jgi:hypothetical protein
LTDKSFYDIIDRGENKMRMFFIKTVTIIAILMGIVATALLCWWGYKIYSLVTTFVISF